MIITDSISLLQTIFSILTAIVIHNHQNKRRKRELKPEKLEMISKEEISIFITMIIMQVAFTLAMSKYFYLVYLALI